MSILPSPPDDYSLDPQQHRLLEQRTKEIKKLIRSTAQNIIDIGDKLHEIKALLGHGNFGLWLKSEFNWSVATATRMMQASQQFKNINLTNLNFSTSAIYLLAAPSTPQEARDEAMTLAEEGKLISYSLSQKLINKHKNNPKSINEDSQFTSLPQLTQNIALQFQDLNPIVSQEFFEQYFVREWLRMRREKQFLSLIMCHMTLYSDSTDNLITAIDPTTYQQLSEIITQQLKRSIDLATYYEEGGFLILLPSTNPEGASQVAKSIQKQTKRLITIDSIKGIQLAVYSTIPTRDISLSSFLNHFSQLSCPTDDTIHEIILEN